MTAIRRYRVELSSGAEQDLDDIVAFVAHHDGPVRASDLLDRLLVTAQTLGTAPQRGSVPRELLSLGIREYRQTMLNPYRLIYTVQDAPRAAVFIVVIADGRRDMASVLQRRLLVPPASPDRDPD